MMTLGQNRRQTRIRSVMAPARMTTVWVAEAPTIATRMTFKLTRDPRNPRNAVLLHLFSQSITLRLQWQALYIDDVCDTSTIATAPDIHVSRIRS